MLDKEIGITKAREEFSKIINDVQYQSGAYVINRHGEKVAAVVPVQVYQDWKKQRREFFDGVFCTSPQKGSIQIFVNTD